MSTPTFAQLATSLKGFQGIVISVDPGETTGWAVFQNYELLATGQLPTASIPFAYRSAHDLFSARLWGAKSKPPIVLRAPDYLLDGILVESEQTTHVVIEDYRVYSWKADDHKFSNVYTVKVLTIFELVAAFYGYPVKLTLAHAAKTFCTDAKLKNWGLWQTGQRHARDAVRHGTFYIVEKSLGRSLTPKDFSK